MALHAIQDDIKPAPADELKATLARQRAAFRRHSFPSLAERRENIRKIERMLMDNRAKINAAIDADFGGRSGNMTEMVDLLPTVLNARDTSKRLNAFMRGERRHVHPMFWLARARVEYTPLGVIGIISPWNYPILLGLEPAIAAFAAGNRVMWKPSELVPRYSDLMAELVADAFDPDLFTVCTGGVDVAQAFTALPFDHLMFTGSTNVGKLVMRAAAENLTPVTLELGGKSPIVVDRDFPVDRVIGPLTIGKLVNSGQTCVAPDYVLVHASQRDALVDAYRAKLAEFLPTMGSNGDCTNIVTERHFDRLEAICADAESKGAKVIRINPAEEDAEALGRKFRPALVIDPTEDMTCMQEELFGPILPVKTYTHMDEVFDYINDHDRPLALYVFTDDGALKERFTQETHSGGLIFNTTIVHVGVDDLPFGGIGASGMGAYHGKEGFETFSHKKPIYEQLKVNGVPLFYPPWGKTFRTILDTLLGK